MADKEPNFQMTFAFIDRQIEENHIQQRLLDGYVNATATCQATGKRINDYLRAETTKEYLEALSRKAQISVSALVQVIKGGLPELQGTWVHPKVAIHLSMWADADIAVQVTEWGAVYLNALNTYKSEIATGKTVYKTDYKKGDIYRNQLYQLIMDFKDGIKLDRPKPFNMLKKNQEKTVKTE